VQGQGRAPRVGRRIADRRGPGRGCRATSVCQWARLYESEGTLGLMSARNAPTPATPGDGMEACGEDELRARLEALRLENAVLRETIKVLKVDGPRHDPAELTNRERTRVR